MEINRNVLVSACSVSMNFAIGFKDDKIGQRFQNIIHILKSYTFWNVQKLKKEIKIKKSANLKPKNPRPQNTQSANKLLNILSQHAILNSFQFVKKQARRSQRQTSNSVSRKLYASTRQSSTESFKAQRLFCMATKQHEIEERRTKKSETGTI